MTGLGQPLQIAVDIGNTCLKLGAFGLATDEPLPKPVDTLVLNSSDWQPDALAAWVARLGTPEPRRTWWLASVNGPAAGRLDAWLDETRPGDQRVRMRAADLPLTVSVTQPHQVGIDRLLGILAARRLSRPGQPVVVVDLGTAIKANLLDSSGAFAGGAIAPGIQLAARALHQQTELLPLIGPDAFTTAPTPVGTSTQSALASGLYWGALGTVRELIARLASAESAEPCVVLTGGDAPCVVPWLPTTVLHRPHLVLSGIVLAMGPPPP